MPRFYAPDDGRPFTFGNGMMRYRDGKSVPVMVSDADRGLDYPATLGAEMSGVFDMTFDGVPYEGLKAPFVIADLGADLVLAFPSAHTVEGTIIIQPGGDRVSDPPADSFVIGDDDIWSF